MTSSGQFTPIVSREYTYTEKNFGEAPPQKECDPCKAVKIIAVAIAIIGLIAGVIGLLGYLGQLSINIAHLGVVTQDMSLIMMLAGFGASCIIGLLIGVDHCMTSQKDSTKSFIANYIECCDSASKEN